MEILRVTSYVEDMNLFLNRDDILAITYLLGRIKNPHPDDVFVLNPKLKKRLIKMNEELNEACGFTGGEGGI